MATRKILYKHIAQTASTYIGRAGELILDTVNKTIRLADGSTAGGTTVVPFFL